jgi:hypothetical protein
VAAVFLAVTVAVISNFAVFYYWWFATVPVLLWLTYLVFHAVRRGRPDRLLVFGLALSAAVVAGAILYIQLAGNPYTTQPRDGELVALVKQTWTGLGLDLDRMYLGPYSYEDREDPPRCRHLPKDDRWESRRGGFGRVDNALGLGLGLERKARSILTSWTVERYEGTGDAPEVLLWAHRRDLALEIIISGDEVNIEASAGPCAVASSRVDDSTFWRRAER